MAISTKSSSSKDVSNPPLSGLQLLNHETTEPTKAHQLQVFLPASMYERVTKLAQANHNVASLNNDSLSEAELDYILSQVKGKGIAIRDQLVDWAYGRKALGYPIAKHLVPRIHRVNRLQVIVRLIQIGLDTVGPVEGARVYTKKEGLKYLAEKEFGAQRQAEKEMCKIFPDAGKLIKKTTKK